MKEELIHLVLYSEAHPLVTPEKCVVAPEKCVVAPDNSLAV
jgi:hypothetical protein